MINNFKCVRQRLAPLWSSEEKSPISGRWIKVDDFVGLSVLPDRWIKLLEVFPEEEIGIIFDRYSGLLGDIGLVPFAGTDGEVVICIGSEGDSFGEIYLYDPDFGLFSMSGDLDVFLSKLHDNPD